MVPVFCSTIGQFIILRWDISHRNFNQTPSWFPKYYTQRWITWINYVQSVVLPFSMVESSLSKDSSKCTLFSVWSVDSNVIQLNLIQYVKNKKSVPVFYCRIKYRYEFMCVWIKSRVPNKTRLISFIVYKGKLRTVLETSTLHLFFYLSFIWNKSTLNILSIP